MNRILVIHRGSLGDFLLLLPTLHALKDRLAGVRVEILGRLEIAGLACPGVADSIASVERAEFVPIFEQDVGLSEARTSYFSSFDAVLAYVLDPNRTLERNLLRLGIGNVIVRPPFPPAATRIHVSEYLLDTIAPLFRDADKRQPMEKRPPRFLAFNEDEMRWAESFLRLKSPRSLFAKEGIERPARSMKRPSRDSVSANLFAGATRKESEKIVRTNSHLQNPTPTRQLRDSPTEGMLPEGGPVIAIHPGSGNEKKCWPVERYEALARRVLGDINCSLLLVLGPADERLTERTTNLGRELNATIAQSLSLRRLAAVLSKCAAYVGNDSGISHMAAAAGTPTLAIFGPTDSTVWAPKGENAWIVRSDIECSPCEREKMRQCVERKCLTAIDVNEVTEAVKRLLRTP
ncbi:glycosyltransferase family 9 protein [Candidatus Poribacteria bacterium]|nr:glycosyltransferase family 9 protein [Candidatus Poribacteria bacterium]